MFFCVCLGEQRPIVLGMEIRDLSLKDPWMKAFGTIHGGLESMDGAWPARCQVFAICREAGKSWFWLIFPCGLDGFGRKRDSWSPVAHTVVLVDLADGSAVRLPPIVAVSQHFMGPETKSNRSLTADVIVASKTVKRARNGVAKTLVGKRWKQICKCLGA
jgi:hypothetical protein